MTARSPIEFTRKGEQNVYTRVGNRVQLEAPDGTALSVQPTFVARAITLTVADTEYPVAIPESAGYEFRARTNVIARYAFIAGQVAGPLDPYLTLQAGEQFHIQAPLAAHTLYLASANAGTVIELLIYEV